MYRTQDNLIVVEKKDEDVEFVTRCVTYLISDGVSAHTSDCFHHRLIDESRFEDAIRFALEKGDLKFLVSTCRRINIGDVFDGQSSLATHVLLALIHQFTSDMASDLGLKARWVREAAQSLDRTHDLFEKHARGVLSDAFLALEVAHGGCQDQAIASELRTCLYVVRTQLS